ncbi:unnamed protein product [Diplocarpon coronariae]
MNEVPLPPDHGHPVRGITPGFVGGRCVKWLHKIWVSAKENDSHYRIWDNRVLPAFIAEKRRRVCEYRIHAPKHRSQRAEPTESHYQASSRGDVSLDRAQRGKTCQLEGNAYEAGSHEVQRVEVSLDDGDTWLYCLRKFPEAPIRHAHKFWNWLHWHLEVEFAHQRSTEADGIASILFRHPVEPGTKDGGWMRLSESERINEAKQAAGAPEKQLTRQEIEKHNEGDDGRIVVNGKLYGATSVLEWIPGGKPALMVHKVQAWQATTEEFDSIHDEYAQQKLNNGTLGVVIEKAATFIKMNAEEAGEEAASSRPSSSDVILPKHRWVAVKLSKGVGLSRDTRRYTFSHPAHRPSWGWRPASAQRLRCEAPRARSPTGDTASLSSKGQSLYSLPKVALIPGRIRNHSRLCVDRAHDDCERRQDPTEGQRCQQERGRHPARHGDQFKMCHVLSHPSDAWEGIRGHVDADTIARNAFCPDGGKESVVFLCGPPATIRKAALPALRNWGYKEEEDCFGC